ncbi:beta-alanine transporter-like isoform X2 [Brevipalpus obovatus]|uniref:beta-alanine transporter-like isoform X2 n=1 Tax=Brevipalpus obovatus TaxID=246614 RepID=UPI003D9E0157
MEFEDILSLLGEDGPFQKVFTFCFLVPVAFITPWLMMTTIFLVSSPKHICSNNVLLKNINRSQIGAYFANKSFSENDSCFINAQDGSRKECDSWIFDQSNYQETFVTHHNLVCSEEHLIGTALAVISVGQLVGTPLFGYIADNYGRKKAYFLGVLISFISTLSPTLTKGIHEFVVLRFVHGLSTNVSIQMPLVMAVEIVGPDRRTRITFISNLVFAMGLATLPLAAYLTGHWLWMSWLSTLITFIALLLFKWVPESPRWLISVRKYKEAHKILMKIGRMNGKKIDSESLMRDIKEVGKKFEKTADSGQASDSVLQCFLNRRILLIISCSAFALLASEVAYTGLHYNVRNFQGNEFLNYFLLASVEPVSYLLGYYLMNSRLGRRWTSVFALSFTGVNLMICAMVNQHDLVRVAIFFMFAKIGATLGYTVIALHVSELLPTVIRNQGLSTVFFILSLGSIAIPYIILLGKYSSHLPLVIMGSIDVAASLLASFLPETRNKILPQTIPESEKLVQERRYWSLAPVRQSDDQKFEREPIAVKTELSDSS